MVFTGLINLVIWLILLGLVWWLIGYIPLPAPIKTIINVIFILLVILIVIDVFGLVNIGVPKLYPFK